jgi:NAD(P)-dependent dehydrogenase (short-subunit alcohol dehydrogenase family)
VLPLDVNDPDAVRETFAHASEALGGLDRVVANAGIASGGPIGSGFADNNRRAVVTNVIGVLNQAEAALEMFRMAGTGHVVLISSMAALRGLGGEANVYSATKAAVSNLGEGLRSELWGSPIKVSTIHPGYIRTAINVSNPQVKFARSLETGSRALVDAIDREPAKAYVPRVPWSLFSMPMRLLPLGLIRRMTG